MAAELETLKAEIQSLGDKIRDLKQANADPAEIGNAVKDLNDAKKKYADQNNGIGVDGKPYEAPLSKAEKKAKAKAEKAAAAGGGGGGQQENQETSANAEKKAAKKAAAKAKKAAIKAGTAVPGGEGGPPPAAAAAKAAPVPPPKAIAAESLQIIINPNLPLDQRPVVALAAAVLTNTALEYTLSSDHRSRQPTLGLPNGHSVVGDFAIARYIVRSSSKSSVLMPQSAAELSVIDTWVDYAQSLMRMDMSQRVPAVALTLMKALQTRTYVVGHSMTLADLCLFAALGFPAEVDSYKVFQSHLPAEATVAARWVDMMRNSPAVKGGTQLAIGVAGNAEAIFEEDSGLEPLVSGMNLLEGGIPGKVVTRFPPEPSGYLHIGHAKAVLLNDYYARRYKGRLIVRFDDTNPSKEKEEYQQSIVEDLERLGVKPDMVTYTSDYFGAIHELAKYMIQSGLAYMDDTPQEQMKVERSERKESKRRNQSPNEAMEYFKMMCSGSEEGSVWCLRAKIDMSSDNGTLRDPVLYRQNTTPHHRTGTTFKAYPTYDLACPIVDSLEGVSHALRTTEYNDRDEQYGWIQKALNLRRVRIHAFSRVNFTNTVLSKRKLTWFVENGYVTGWDDARFPTVRGVVRRGVNITALRAFMYSQGASRRVVNMVWNTFWAENKKEIDKNAQRFMAIDGEEHTVLRISGVPKEESQAYLETQVHPKDPSLGMRVMRISDEVILEKEDTDGIVEGEDIVLLHWGVVKITKVGDALEGTFVPDGDFKQAKRKLSWLANVSDSCPVVLTEFDNLITKEKLEEEDKFEDFINPNTLAMTDAKGDAGLKSLVKDDIIQLERRGYYRVDRPYINSEKPLILFVVPDGRSKSMSGKSGKLAHR